LQLFVPNPNKPEQKIFTTKSQRHEGFHFVIRSYGLGVLVAMKKSFATKYTIQEIIK
jgi:hypothetical protein